MKKDDILIALVIIVCLFVIGYIDYGDTIHEWIDKRKSEKSSFLTSEEWESQEHRLIKQAEQRGFQKGVLQHALNTKWRDFADKDFYTYIKTLKSGMQLYRAELPNMMMEVYVLNNVIVIQSSSIMTGRETQQVYMEMDAWLKSCNPISTSNSFFVKDGEATNTYEYLFQDFTATIVKREQGIQYMLSLNEEKKETGIILDKQFSNKYFSIKYPSSWQIVQEENQATNNTAVSLQIMEKQKNEYDFRPNINIIVSNKKWSESTAYLTEQTSHNNRIAIPDYKQLAIFNNASLGKCKGSLLWYSFTIQGYYLRGSQYIVKKSDNTTFIITATMDSDKYNEQTKTIHDILESLIIN